LEKPTIHENVRAYGTGCFQQKERTDKSGRTKKFWQGYVYAYDKAKKWGTGRTQREAEQNAMRSCAAYEIELRKGEVDLLPPVPTMSGFAESLIAKMDLRYKTRRRYLYFAKMWRDPVLGDVGHAKTVLGEHRLDTLTFAHLDAFMLTHRRRYSPSTSDDMQTFIRQILKKAVKYGYLQRNLGEDLDPIRVPVKQSEPIDDEQFALLFVAADCPRMRAYLTLAYYGCRIGEVLGLTSDCIEGNTINVAYQLSRTEHPDYDDSLPPGKANPKTRWALLKLKTPSSMRRIQLTSEEMEFVTSSLFLSSPAEIWTYDQGFQTKRFLVPGEDGLFWKDNTFGRCLRKLADSIGIDVTSHEFRAMFITDMIDEGGLDVKLVSKMAGHSRTEVTQNVYHRVRRPKLDKAFQIRSKMRRHGLSPAEYEGRIASQNE
jgi:integrase